MEPTSEAKISALSEQIQIVSAQLESVDKSSSEWQRLQIVLSDLVAERMQLLETQDLQEDDGVDSYCTCRKTVLKDTLFPTVCHYCGEVWVWDQDAQLYLIKDTPSLETVQLHDTEEREKEKESEASSSEGSSCAVESRPYNCYCTCGKTRLSKFPHSLCNHCGEVWLWNLQEKLYIRKMPARSCAPSTLYHAGVTRPTNSDCVCSKTRLYLCIEKRLVCRVCLARWEWNGDFWVLQQEVRIHK